MTRWRWIPGGRRSRKSGADGSSTGRCSGRRPSGWSSPRAKNRQGLTRSPSFYIRSDPFFSGDSMAEAAAALDLKEILSTEDLSLDKLHEVRREVHSHVDLRSQLDELVADFGTKIAKSLSSDNKVR